MNHTEQHHTEPHHKDNGAVEFAKKVFDEKNMDKAETALDKKMAKLTGKGRAEKFAQSPMVKNVLNSKVVNDSNHKISTSLKTIFLVLGWIALISGLVGIFSFLVSLSGLGFVFSFGFGIGLRVVIYLLIALLFSLLSLLAGFGMIKMKKWLPAIALVSFVVSIVTFVIGLIPSGFYASVKYGSFGSGLLNLIVTIVILIVIFKNKDMFNK